MRPGRVGFWQAWRSRVIAPLTDAALGRWPNTVALRRHAADFPGARAAAEASAEAAADLGFAVDRDWIDRHLLSAALDRQDNFARLVGRSLTSPERLEVRGSWPGGVFVALGLHWGAGFPALEHLARQSRQPAFVYRAEQAADLPSLSERLYDRLHLRALRGFGNTIRVGGAYQRIIEALAAGRIPVVLLDAPATPGSKQSEAQCCGYRVSLRSGLPGLLAAKHIPHVYFRCSQRPGERRRLLEISPPQQADSADEVVDGAAAFLLDSLVADSAQWHLWPVAGSVLQPLTGARSGRPDEHSLIGELDS